MHLMTLTASQLRGSICHIEINSVHYLIDCANPTSGDLLSFEYLFQKQNVDQIQ